MTDPVSYTSTPTESPAKGRPVMVTTSNPLPVVNTSGLTGSAVTSDTAVKSGSGFLNALTFYGTDAAATAGSIVVYDNTAGSGTILFSYTVAAAALAPFTVFPQVNFSTGLYIKFNTTNDVAVTPSYR